MTREFNGTTDLIDVGSRPSLDDVGGSPGERSIAALVYPTDWGEASFGRVWDKAPAGGGWVFFVQNGDGASTSPASFQLQLGGSTTGRACGADNTLALNTWWFIAGSFTPSDGGPRLYVGSRTAAMAEVTYSVRAGDNRVELVSYGSDAAQTGYLGNRGAADRTFQGRIGHLSIWDGRVSLAHFELIRQNPVSGWRFVTTGRARGVWNHLDVGVRSHRDESGFSNHGVPNSLQTLGSNVDMLPKSRMRL